MNKKEIRHSTGYNIHVVSHLLQNMYNEKLSAYGLTHAQARVIYLLASYGPQSPTDLQKRLYIQSSSMNGIIESLLKHDRISKKADPNDKRAKVVALTPKGEELHATIIDIISSIETRLTDGLSKEEQEQAVSLLQRIQENIRPVQTEKNE